MSPVENSEFVEQARQRVEAYARTRRRDGFTDKLYAVVQSESGNLYEGVPLEVTPTHTGFCAERHAINNMLHAESESAIAEAVLVATPAPDESTPPTTPCGTCRHVIHECSDDADVYCTTYVRETDGWTMFPQVETYTATGLYPDHEGHPSWK